MANEKSLSELTKALESMEKAIQPSVKALSSMTAAYASHQQAEAQLAASMRNSMGAREENIQSIKNLCAAQQQLGVVSDDVQLAGAKQMATYLSEVTSLERLIPVMNDLLVHQYGLNSSQENAIGIASAFGQVINGQTGALAKYGYTFDDAQTAVMQFGTESERVATLIDLVSTSVGGMNSEMANTTAGGIKQFENDLVSFQTQIGEFTATIASGIEVVSNFVIGVSGIVRVYTTVQTLSTTLKELNITQAITASNAKLTAMAMTLLSKESQFTTGVAQKLSVALTGGTYSANAFKLALRGLMLATGVGAIIAGVTALISCFSDAADNASCKTHDMGVSTDAYVQAAANAKLEIDSDINALGRLIEAKEDTTEALQKLNDKYGDFFGRCNSAEEMYNTLTEKSQLYIKQLGLEAQALAVTKQMAEIAAQKLVADQHIDDLKKDGKDTSTVNDYHPMPGQVSGTRVVETKEFREAQEVSENLGIKYAELQENLDAILTLMGQNSQEMGNEATEVANALQVEEMSYDQVTKAIQRNTQAMHATSDESIIADLRAQNKELERRKSYLDGRMGTKGVDKKQPKPEVGSIGWYDDRIRELKLALNVTNSVEASRKIREEIKQLEREKGEFIMAVKFEEPEPVQLSKIDMPIKLDIPLHIDPQTLDLDIAMPEIINKLQDAGQTLQDAMQQSFSGVGSALSSIGGMLDEETGQWMQWGSSVLQACSQALPAIMAVTAGEAAKSAAQTPVVGWILAGAAIAGVIAAFASIPKFADGGIISGPTIGLMGEYAGAATNPEVVAPLDKLRAMLNPTPANGGAVEFRISGRNLVGVLGKENNLLKRT